MSWDTGQWQEWICFCLQGNQWACTHIHSTTLHSCTAKQDGQSEAIQTTTNSENFVKSGLLSCWVQKGNTWHQLRETNTIQEHFSSLAELDQSQTVTQQSGQQARTVITHVIVGKLIETYFLLKRDRKHKSVYPDIWYLLLKWSQEALSFFTQLLSPPLIPVSSSPLPFKTLKQKIYDKSKNNYAIMAAHSCGVLLALLYF